jgi:hypothetical protein
MSTHAPLSTEVSECSSANKKAARGRLSYSSMEDYFAAGAGAAAGAAASLAAGAGAAAGSAAAAGAAAGSGAGAGAGAAAGAGAGAASSFLPQADRATAATREANRSDVFIDSSEGFL